MRDSRQNRKSNGGRGRRSIPGLPLLLLTAVWGIVLPAGEAAPGVRPAPPRAEVLQEDAPAAPAPAAHLPADGVRHLWLEMNWDIRLLSRPEGIALTTLVPRTIPGRQEVEEVYANYPPERVFEKGENKYLRWQRENPGTETFRLMLVARVTLFSVSFPAAGAEKIAREAPGFWEARRLRAPERLVEADAAALSAAARTIPDGDSAVATAREVMGFVRNKLSYEGFVEKDRGALGALQAGGGDCTDYADLFVALCRAKGLPARHLSGILLGWTATPAHSWADFYDPALGWVPVDPLQIDLGAAEFGTFAPKYIQLSAVRSDPQLENGMLYFWRVLGSGGAKVEFRAAGREDSPLQALPQVAFSRIR